MLEAGFAKVDITPRVGVELAGFGPFFCRNSTGIHSPLWAKATALKLNESFILIICCDLIGITKPTTNKIRKLINKHSGLSAESIMISSTHTHSGPNPSTLHGWGEGDLSYIEALPFLIAQSGIKALNNLQPATLHHAEVPCENFSFNREVEQKGQLTLEQLRQNTWQPKHPEKTDRTSHIISAYSNDKLIGFICYYSCHPVTCCENNTLIHGDFCSTATAIIEHENNAAIGLFLQGAHGDVNTCFCHQPAEESIQALDILSKRFAEVIRQGLANRKLLNIDEISTLITNYTFSRRNLDTDDLKGLLAQCESVFSIDATKDQLFGPEARRNTVIALTLRNLLKKQDANLPFIESAEIFGAKIGPIELLGSGFETYQAIKNDITKQTSGEIPLVCSLVNDGLGYAIDQETAAKGGYASEYAPFILGTLPYSNIHEELLQCFINIDTILYKQRDKPNG